MFSHNESSLRRRRSFREKFGWRATRSRAFNGIRLVRRGNILAFRLIGVFLLDFWIFTEAMFFARTTKNQPSSTDCSGGFANTKMHKALGQ
jgi:hypothetical protein